MLFETAENLQGERQKEVWILPPVHVSVYGGGSQIKIVSDITATSIREVAAAIRSSWLHDAPRSSSLALYVLCWAKSGTPLSFSTLFKVNLSTMFDVLAECENRRQLSDSF